MPAPILICAHAAGTCGPFDQAGLTSDAATSAPSRSPVCSATDSRKIVIRSDGKDHGDELTSGTGSSAACSSAWRMAALARLASPASADALAS